MAYAQEKNQSLETVPERVLMLDLLDKTFKSAIMNMFCELQEAMS